MDPRFPFGDDQSARTFFRVFADIMPYGTNVVLRRGVAVHLFVLATAVAVSTFVDGLSWISGANVFMLLFISLVAYAVGTGFAIVFGLPVAAVLEWMRWRSWAVYLIAGTAVGLALPLALGLSPTQGRDNSGEIVFWGSLAYCIGYAVIYRYRMLPPPDLERRTPAQYPV